MICPKCKADIPADSWYCDQCGEQLMFCPKCNEPRKGKRCTQCGSLLVAGQDLASAQSTIKQVQGGSPQGSAPTPQSQPQSHQTQQSSAPTAPPQGNRPPQGHSGTMRPGAGADPEPTRMVRVDNPQQVVTFKDNAVIGRTTGDYLAVFSSCPYVSGTHARITRNSSMKWMLTDVGSTNGTQINGMPLVPDTYYPLSKGQVVEIGFVKFRVE